MLGWGTPAYMAPEQFPGAQWPQGPWTDLYAVGCLAWALTRGRPPHARLTPQEIAIASRTGTAVASAAPLRVPAPADLDGWIQRLLMPSPRDRFHSAAQALAALGAIPDAPLRPVRRRPLPDSAAETVSISDRSTPPMPATSRAPSAAAAPAARPALAVPPSWRGDSDLPSRALGRSDVSPALIGLREVPLVGREGLRDALWAWLGDASGSERVIALVGPPGVGRSALARWLCVRAAELGLVQPIEARHAPALTPIDGVGPALARALRCEARRIAQVRLRLPALASADEAALAGLLLSPHGAGEAGVRFALTEQILRAMAAEGAPPLLWLDDAQWSPDALPLIRHLRRQRSPARILLTAAPDASLPPDTEVLTVPPMGAAEMRALIRSHLSLAPALEEQIMARVGGDPLLALQLLDALAQELEPSPTGGDWQLRSGARLALPEDAGAVWRARLDGALGGDGAARAALELGAALGIQLDEREWRLACEAAGLPFPDAALGDLAAQGLVAALPPHGWRLAHPRLRAALLQQSAEAGRLAGLHEACSAAVEAPDRRGRHLIEAGELELALGPVRASIHLADHDREGAQVLARCATYLGLLDRCGALAGDERRRIPRLLEVKHTFLSHGAERALPLARRLVDDASAHGWDGAALEARAMLARIHLHRGDVDGAWAHLAPGEADAGRPDLLAEHRSHWHGALADVRRRRGDLGGAVEGLRAALSIAEDCGGSPRLIHGKRIGLAWMLLDQGRLDEVRALMVSALRERAGGRWSSEVAEIRNLLGEVSRMQGRLPEAAGHYREALAHYVALGDMGAAVCQANLGAVLLGQGEAAEARPHLRTALEVLDGAGLVVLALHVRCILLRCDAALGEEAAYARNLDAIEAAGEQLPAHDEELVGYLRAAADGAPWRALAARTRALLSRS